MEAKCPDITTKENSEAMDIFFSETENTVCSSKLSLSITPNSLISTNQEYVCPAMDWMNKYLNNLKIQEDLESNAKQDGYLAGNIDNVIETLNVVLVKPLPSDALLYFGTPLFLNCTNLPKFNRKYILLGYIDDIFGSIEEPMYSINIKSDFYGTLDVNTEVYFFPNNPSTFHMYIEHTTDEISNKKKYRIKRKHI